jgi:AraC-like DNA-binding protein
MIKRLLLEISIDHRTVDEEALINQIRDLVSKASSQYNTDGCFKCNAVFEKLPLLYDVAQTSINEDNTETFNGEHNSFRIGSCSFNITAKGNSANDFVNTCIDLISNNLEDENFTIQVMASRLNFSKPTFYRKIKQATGLSAITFVRQVKMQIACKMLQTKSFTVSEVAWRCGYSSARHFSKIFYAMFNQYPSSFLT